MFRGVGVLVDVRVGRGMCWSWSPQYKGWKVLWINGISKGKVKALLFESRTTTKKSRDALTMIAVVVRGVRTVPSL